MNIGFLIKAKAKPPSRWWGFPNEIFFAVNEHKEENKRKMRPLISFRECELCSRQVWESELIKVPNSWSTWKRIRRRWDRSLHSENASQLWGSELIEVPKSWSTSGHVIGDISIRFETPDYKESSFRWIAKKKSRFRYVCTCTIHACPALYI